MQTSIYFNEEDAKTKEILKRIKILQDNYKVSFGRLVLSGLELLIKVKSPQDNADFRTARLVGVK